LRGAGLRLDKLRADAKRDGQRAAEMAGLEQNYRRELASRAKAGTLAPEIEQFGWLLEELRISLFAQELKTPVPVSVKRLAKLWHSMRV
jgi:ATP-dependent helicase HrpA